VEPAYGTRSQIKRLQSESVARRSRPLEMHERCTAVAAGVDVRTSGNYGKTWNLAAVRLNAADRFDGAAFGRLTQGARIDAIDRRLACRNAPANVAHQAAGYQGRPGRRMANRDLRGTNRRDGWLAREASPA